MAESYWTSALTARLSRRRAITTSSAAVLGAAFLAACGGGSKSSGGSSGPKDTSGLLTPPVDETKSLKRGGVMKAMISNDVPNMDPYLTNNGILNRFYNQFFYVKGGYMSSSKGEVAGDLAESWEFSPDKLQLTLKMSKQAHFAPLAPVNGRAPDAQDVVYSYNRLKAIGTRRANLAHDINPQAPVESITAPDDNTVIVKFSEPLATVLYLFSNWTSVNLFIVPKEADDQKKLDLRRTFLGTGPWYLSDYSPSVRFVLKRNPGFNQDPRQVPYIDSVEMPIIPEYATGLAQLKSGHLYVYEPGVNSGVRAEDLVATKKSVPDLVMMATEVITSQFRNIFGWLPDSAFKDERVRQAWSMSMDRDLYNDVTSNVSDFQKQGLPMETRWNSALQAETWDGWWLDPRGKDFGPNAKYYQHDIAEAKKLLSAAGHPNGLDHDTKYSIGNGYGAAYNKACEIILAMIADAGFKPKITDIDFNTEYANVYRAPGGKFSGSSFIQSFSAQLEPVEYLSRFYGTTGSDFRGFDADGKGNGAGDPVFEDLIPKMKREFDDKKRQAMVQDFQRQEGRKQYFTAFPGGANSFTLAWPVVRGRYVWRGEAQRIDTTIWLDDTKAPLKS